MSVYERLENGGESENGGRKMKINVGVVVKNYGVLVRKMGECESMEDRWKSGAKIRDCELFELFYRVLGERIQLMRIYVLEKVIQEL